ncbi:MAG: hypothetical protein E7533_07495 [Ruminococcaceae bacterium]|nr:hypothetical protein [Oscillospiraceae bacterium]
MNVFVLAGASIIGIVMLSVLKNSSGEIATIARVGFVFVILLAVLPEINTLKNSLALLEKYDFFSTSSMKILFKAFGILSIGSVAADICRDNSEGAIANVIEICVKILALCCALPVFTAVIEIAASF